MEARFADGTALSSDVLIGCDGLRSTVRRLVLPRAPSPRFTGLFDYGGFVAASAAPVPPGITRFVFGRRAFFGAFTTAEGELWWFHSGAGDESEVATKGDDAASRARLLERHAEDEPWINDAINATPSILGPWPIHELLPVRPWHAGRPSSTLRAESSARFCQATSVSPASTSPTTCVPRTIPWEATTSTCTATGNVTGSCSAT